MNIKDQIRAEIMRLKLNVYDEANQFDIGARSSLTYLDSFLDTIPEQPASEELDAEMDEIWLEYCEDVDYLVYASIARRFAEWGAEHLKR